LLLLVQLAATAMACGGNGRYLPVPRPQPKLSLDDYYESKLNAAQPLEAGEFRVYALDEELRDDSAVLSALSVSAEGGVLSLATRQDAPGAMYLYVRLPSGSHFADLRVTAPPTVIALALPGKLKRVVPIALAAIGAKGKLEFALELKTRDLALEPAETALAFLGSDRQELALKAVADTFPEPVEGLQATANGTWVDLTWDERNIGDYDNGGEVGISDITPMAMHYGAGTGTPPQELTPEEELADGSGDGKVTIEDITPIAINYGLRLDGYDVFALEIPSLDTEVSEEDFAGVPAFPDPDNPETLYPSVKRGKFYVDSRPPKHRITYAFGWDMDPGVYAFAVRASDLEGGDAGPFSNIVKEEFAGGENHPPVWSAAGGIQSAIAGNAKVTVTFGDAYDPDGDDIYYVIYYQIGDTVIPGTAETLRVDYATLPQPAPFSAEVTGLTNGEQYAFMVWVFDEHDLRENPPNDIVLTATPKLYEPNDLPWPFLRKDEQRTGILDGGLREPLVELWHSTYKVSGGYNESSPVLDDYRVYIGSVDGRVYAFNQFTGGDGEDYATPVENFLSVSTAALWDDYLVIGGKGKFYGLRRSDGVVVRQFDLVDGTAVQSSPLIVDGIVYAGSNEGVVYAFDLETSADVWSNPVDTSRISSSPVTDGNYIYIATEDGYVHKLDIETGIEQARSPDLGEIHFATPVLYPADSPQVVIIGVDTAEIGNSAFYALSVESMAKATTYETDYGVQGTPVVVEHDGQTLVIAGQGEIAPPSGMGKVSAHDLVTGELVWETEDIGRVFASPAASENRIFVGAQDGNFYVIDFAGNIKQTLDLGSAILTSAALVDNRVYVATTDEVLYCLEAQEDTMAPVWHGTEGVRAVSTDSGEVTLEWDYATDNFYSPVYYQVYYSTEDDLVWWPPQVTDIPGEGEVTHSCTVPGLDDGVRYYFGVRASDRPLWDDANIEQNENIMGATPPWNLYTELTLGEELPAAADTVLTYTGAAWRGGKLHGAYATEGPADEDDNLYYFTYDGTTVSADDPILGTPSPSGFVARCMELSFNSLGEPVISFADTSDYRSAERTAENVWDLATLVTTDVPAQPAFSSAFGSDIKVQAMFEEITPPPPVEVTLWARLWDDIGGWGSFEEPDNSLDKGMDVRALLADFGEGDVPLVFYEKAAEFYPGSSFPSAGELWLAEHSETEGWTASVLDEGTNTGRNLSAIWDGSSRAHLVYYDLHSSGFPLTATLRYATYDGTSFTAEDVMSVALPEGGHPSADYYYHTPGIALVSGEPVIAAFSRLTNPPSAEDPYHLADVYYCRFDEGEWVSERVVEDIGMYLHFNVAVQVTGDGFNGYPMLVFPAGPEEPGSFDHLEIWQRGPLAP